MNYIAADIGGTSVKAALFSDGRIIGRAKVISADYFSKGMAFAVYDVVRSLIENAEKADGSGQIDLKTLCNRAKIEGIAVCTAGDTDPYNGVILYATGNIPGYTGTRLKEAIENECGTQCSVINDVHAAALCEWVYGALKGYSRAAMITIGTGVGGAVISDGNIEFGEYNDAYRLGHLVFEDGGRLCTCGKRGCIEAYVSATALLAEARAHGFLENLQSLFKAYNNKELTATIIVGDYLARLARAVEIIFKYAHCEVLCVGGGITGSADLWFDDLKEMCGGKVVCAKYRNDAGMTGALLWYHKLFG